MVQLDAYDTGHAIQVDVAGKQRRLVPLWLVRQIHGPTVLHYGTYCDRMIILGDIGWPAVG